MHFLRVLSQLSLTFLKSVHLRTCRELELVVLFLLLHLIVFACNLSVVEIIIVVLAVLVLGHIIYGRNGLINCVIFLLLFLLIIVSNLEIQLELRMLLNF